ncbi:uncharacterized protein AB675_594 [Cyphellophora attinorum]|uniref:Methyltransferase domain-containing protein n=1 Tax=Cyphellophora attinorum TaxID=1664694 RepID=A0A0N1HGS0_9EURO|nr:uncharacterized protein AB675_594 [Phialophora attinorum]KPI45476.1 hypothetical protein AB675_594 [Phialophora attinorum]
MSQTDTSSTGRTWEVYIPHLNSIPPAMSDLLEHYAHVPPGPNHQTQIDHVLAVRDPVYKSNPYPCIGRFRFLTLDLATHCLYKTDVLPRMTSTSSPPQIFLDLGTCLSQDMRKLIYDGAPPLHCYGADIIPAYIDAGYKLFNDAERFPRDTQFFCPMDIFDEDPSSNPLLKGSGGKVDIIHATAFFHLFSWDQQLVVAAQCLRLLRKQGRQEDEGCLILGKQVGYVEAQESQRRDNPELKSFRHNEASWRKLWESVVREEEFRDVVKEIRVEVHKMHERHEGLQAEDGKGVAGGQASMPSGFRWMEWSVRVWF